MSYQGPSEQWNQSVFRAESGVVVVAQVSDAVEYYYEFIVQSLIYGTTNTSGVTLQGYGSLEYFIRAVAEGRLNTVQIKQAGTADTDGNFTTVRYWSDSLRADEAYQGQYSGKLVFRKEIS